ncbi:MAG: hypothetical protein AAF677_02435 [Pseudomonadota bacterium]
MRCSRIALSALGVLIGFGWAALPAAADEAYAYSRPAPKQGYSYPDCYCTDSDGTRVEVGQLACLTINRRQVTARCEQASNLVIWRTQRDGCAVGPSS